jgi:hypothetical protein
LKSRVRAKTFSLSVLIFCCWSVVLADDFKTLDGKKYNSVTVSRVEPDGIVLITDSGISKVYFTELPKEVQERFHYDPAKAAAYSSNQAAIQQAFQKQQRELQRKIADDKSKYWIGQEPIKKQQADARTRQGIVRGLQERYAALQREEDDLRARVREAERLPPYLHGQSGSKYYSYPNPARQYIPEWNRRLGEIRSEQEQLRRQLEHGY